MGAVPGPPAPVDAACLTGNCKPWGTTIDNAALLMAGDLHAHLGQLIAYARTNRVKPPWTKQRLPKPSPPTS